MVPLKKSALLISRVLTLILAWFFLFAFLVPAHAEESQSFPTEHFVFYFSPPDQKLAKYLADLSEKIYADIVFDAGVEPRPGIEIYIEHTHEAFLSRQPHPVKAQEWAAGLAYPELNLVILKAPHAALYGTIDPVKTLRHELSHLVLHQALAGARIPRWLDEGFAMYEAREWTLRTTAVITTVTLKKNFIPLTSLEHEFPVAFSEAEVAYAQSFSMVSYLLSSHGRDAFHQFILNLKKGEALSQCMQNAFGISFYEMEQKWHKYLRLRYTWIPVITSSAALWFLVSVSFLFVYLRKKHQARQTVMEWELEDMWEDESGHSPDS
ncbi:MAG: peptidase MA family metallohydrolase [bacterium]